jgi:hypothetical protein
MGCSSEAAIPIAAVVPPVAIDVNALVASPAVPASVMLGGSAARAAATSALAGRELRLGAGQVGAPHEHRRWQPGIDRRHL